LTDPSSIISTTTITPTTIQPITTTSTSTSTTVSIICKPCVNKLGY
jgi:hypothetical protein